MPQGLVSNPVFVRSDWAEGNLAQHSLEGGFPWAVLNKVAVYGRSGSQVKCHLAMAACRYLRARCGRAWLIGSVCTGIQLSASRHNIIQGGKIVNATSKAFPLLGTDLGAQQGNSFVNIAEAGQQVWLVQPYLLAISLMSNEEGEDLQPSSNCACGC